jgi:transcriptional regulator with XRE-family HTH domain
MAAIGQTIRNLRIERGLTLKELGELVGLSTGAVGKKERGELSVDGPERARFAAALGISLEELDQAHKNATGKPMSFPVLNRGVAGVVVDVEDPRFRPGDPVECVDAGAVEGSDLFAVIASNDTMSPRILPGDYVLMQWLRSPDKMSSVEPGTVVLIEIVDNGFVFGRWFIQENKWMIAKDNPTSPPIMLEPNRVERAAVLVERRTRRV